MKRRAIIIGNEGIPNSDDSHYLGGVQTDIRNFYKFIRSDFGGAWNKREIMPFEANKIDFEGLKKAIMRERNTEEVDYWFIYFSGHGGESKSGVDYLEIKPGSQCSIPELLAVLGEDTRVLLIADACRYVELLEGKGKMSTNKYFSDSVIIDTKQRINCRELYNNAIAHIPVGSFFLGQACSPGQYSRDGGIAIGGIYTAALLKYANKMIRMERAKKLAQEEYSHIISFSSVHYYAAKEVPKAQNMYQQPTFSGPRCFQPPFCVID